MAHGFLVARDQQHMRLLVDDCDAAGAQPARDLLTASASGRLLCTTTRFAMTDNSSLARRVRGRLQGAGRPNPSKSRPNPSGLHFEYRSSFNRRERSAPLKSTAVINVPARSAPQFDGAAVEIQIVAGNCGGAAQESSNRNHSAAPLPAERRSEVRAANASRNQTRAIQNRGKGERRTLRSATRVVCVA